MPAPWRVTVGLMPEVDQVSGGHTPQMKFVEQRLRRAAAHTQALATDLRRRLVGHEVGGPLTELVVSRLRREALPRLEEATESLSGYAGRLQGAINRQEAVSRPATFAAPSALNVASAQQNRQLQEVRRQLIAINKIINNPANYRIRTLAAAIALRTLLEHREAWLSSNPHVGKYRGGEAEVNTMNPNTRRSVGIKTDCTIFVRNVFREAFQLKGEGARFDAIYREAVRRSGGNIRGNELLQLMRTELDMRGVYFAPNPADPSLRGPNNQLDANGKTVAYYGVPVDPSMELSHYSAGNPSNNIRKLGSIDGSVGVGISNGGDHMFLYVTPVDLPDGTTLGGWVVESHIGEDATSYTVIEATPLEDWRRFNKDGVIVFPRSDLEQAFGRRHNEPPPLQRRR
jgi:hypothetical protein